MITTEYTDLLAVLPEAYLLVSGGGQILAANDRAAALLGRDRGALVGSAIFDLVEEPREAVNARLEEWSGARAPTSAALALRGDAQRVWFDAAVVRPMAPDRSASILLRLRRVSAAPPRFAPFNEQLDELYREVDERRRAADALRDATERLTLALDAGRMGTWEWDIATNAVVWSETLERIHGLEPGSFPGTFDAFASGIHPSDLERVLETVWRTVREGRRSYRTSYRMRRPDGGVRVLRAEGRLITDWRGEPVRMIGVCMDDTDRTAAEERERLLAVTGAVLSAAAEPEQALAEVAHLATGLLADTCSAYLREGDALRLLTVAHANPEHASLVAALSTLGPIHIDEDHGLAHVVRTGETVFIPDISDAHFEGMAAADERTRIWRAFEPRSTIVAPVAVRGEVVGALALATLAGGKRRLTRRDVPVAEELARRIAAVVELGRLVAGLRREVDARRRNEIQLEHQASRLRDVTAELETRLAELQAAHRGLAEAERRTRFLAAAGQALASSLDYETTLRTIAELAVPEIADWCAVDLREGDEIRRVAVAHADPARRRAIEELVREKPLRLDAPAGIGAVIRTGQPQLYGEADIADLELAVSDIEEAPLLRLIGLRSAILVPLELRGECIGALTLAQDESGRRFHQDDITFALDLAHRAATAIENARLFRRAQDALHARDDVLAVVSHDLRNPIALVETGVRTLLDPSLSEERRRAVLGSALRATAQANRLIDDLLDIARSEAGHLSLDRSPLSPGTAVDDVIDAFRGAAEEAGIVLRAEVDPDLPLVHADPARVHRVLTNLIANSLRFTPRGGRVVLSAASGDPCEVVFTVADTGPGIPARDQPHVFRHFWQAAPHARAGAGLGLAIARSIVEAHGGRIWVESEPGNGCSFFFTLPTLQPEGQMSSGKSSDAARSLRHRDADRYLAAIVESSDDAIFGKTLDGIITSWNHGAERIYGYTAQEAIGQPVSILVPPDIENDVPALLERLRRGERIDHFETLRQTKDGRCLNISLTISPIHDDDGRIIGASTIARDVTAQVEARRALEENRWELEVLNVELEQTIEELERQRNAAEAEAERMRRLQRITTDLTASLEPSQVLETIIREVIEAADAYAGGVAELSADGRELITVLTRGYDAARLQAFVRLDIDQRFPACDAVRTGEPVFIGSLSELKGAYPAFEPIHHGDGAWVALPLKARGRIIGALTMTFPRPREFTQADRTFILTLAVQCAQALDRAQLYDSERQARREAQEASRAKSNFLAVMSHELRTPLTAILGYGALLEDEIVGPLNERQRDQIQRMRESGRHLLGLIDQILSLSRIEAGREHVDVQSLDAADLIRDVAAMIGPLANRAGLRLELDVPDASAEMRSDAGKIRQILLNLASNAVKFTDHGHVDLRLEVDGDVVLFHVADTGPGISPEDRERIFHPFEQIAQGPTRPKGGTGLGLTVSLELARLLGGDITLESEVGRGSTFTVRLPRVGPGARR